MGTDTVTLGPSVTMTTKPEITLDMFLDRKYGTTLNDLSTRANSLINRFLKYVDEMHPLKPNTRENTAKLQSQFLLIAQGILDSESPADAMLCWDVLLFVALKNRDLVFNEKNACRHYNVMPQAQQQSFLHLMTLVLTTMDIRTRKAALRTKPLETVYPFLNEKQKTNLTAYYAKNV